MDLSTSPAGVKPVPAEPAQLILPLGWMADGRLVLVQNPSPGAALGSDYQFQLLDPASGQIQILGSRQLMLAGSSLMATAIDGKLAVDVVEETGDAQGQIVVHPAALTLAHPLELQVLTDEGFAAALSPDGRWLAYLPADAVPAGRPWPPAHITLFDTLSEQSLQILISESTADGRLLHDPSSLTWLPDGSGLVFTVWTGDARTRLMRLNINVDNPSSGANVGPIAAPNSIASIAGISADGRYLAAAVPAFNPIELIVLDLEADQVVRRAAIAPAAPPGAWSPTGHLLAVPGPAGLYVLDAATGQQQWITNGVCRPAWYELGGDGP